jgi:inositol 2-dehydrogenase
MTLGVGVIGTGAMGRRHAENLAGLWPRARVLAVADASPTAAQSVAEALECDWYADAQDLLDRTDIQAVVIAANDATHADFTIAAAERGKDIFCEKPLAITVEDARAAAAAAERAAVRLQVGFMRRYDPGYRAARDAIDRGEIGKPILFHAISRDPQPPPLSYFTTPNAGGIFLNSGIHDFDLARWLMADEVQTVSAVGALLSTPELADVQPIDTGIVTLTYQSGALGIVQLSRHAVYGYDIRTEVGGSEGTVTIGDHRWRPVQVLQAGGITHTMPQHWLDRFGEAYALEMADWVRRMAGDLPPAVTAEDGIRSVAIALAAERSVQVGRPVSPFFD